VEKDFDRWNKTKKKIDSKNRPMIKLGEVFWCSFGLNIGYEQNEHNKNFHRPVVIIKKFTNTFVLVAPLTTKFHKGSWFYNMNIFGKRQQIILNQIRPIDTRRLNKSIGEISINEVEMILKQYIKLIL
jgi:mRNA interferase MazF